MPMPFVKESSVSAPVEPIKRKSDDGTEPDSLETAMEELCRAIESKNYSEAASVFRACFDLLEEQPHDEEESTHE